MIFKININRRIIYSLAILLFIHAVLLFNTRFTLWPEMVVYPYLANNGFLLYRDIINPYPPLLTWLLALFAKIFGYTPAPYQILTWIIIVAIDLSIFLITKKLFKNIRYALASTAFFVLFSVPLGINGLWFDLVQTPFILWAIYFFYKFLNAKNMDKLKFNFFISVLFLTIGFFIKQQVFWVALLFLILALLKHRLSLSKFFKNHYLAVLPFCALLIFHLLYFFMQGTLTDFMFWVFKFPLIASKIPGYVQMPSTRQLFTVVALFVIFTPVFLKKPARFFVIAAFVLALFAYPRFDYFHLIPTLAVLSFLAGLLAETVNSAGLERKIIFLVSIIVLSGFSVRSFINNWGNQIRFFEPGIVSAAAFLSLVIPKDEAIYIQNGPDQLLVLSDHLPAKPWADEFPWYLEIENVQKRVVEGIETSNTKFVVSQSYLDNGVYGLGSYKPRLIVDLIDKNFKNLLPLGNSLWLKARK